MLMAGLLALALSANNALPMETRTLSLQKLSGSTDKALLLERRRTSQALHRLHAHIGPDGRTIIGCQLSHRQVPDMRQLLRPGQVRP